jgi:hypothetical protein
MCLALVAKIGKELHLIVCAVTELSESIPPFALKFQHGRSQQFVVTTNLGYQATAALDRFRGSQHSKSRKNSWKSRHKHASDTNCIRDAARVKRAGATERDQGEVGRVESSLKAHSPNRAGCVCVDDRHHTCGRPFRAVGQGRHCR